ncbi:unnamed protein product [Musa hybrid cultivar]
MSAVKAVRRVQERGSGFFDPDLGNALVPDLCVVNKSSSLWELLGQIMASRFVSPIHALAFLISRAVRAIPHRLVHYLEHSRLRLDLVEPCEFLSSFRDSINGSPVNTLDDSFQRPMLPGWNIKSGCVCS